MEISSIILAGGRATRMGGVDKGLVAFQQKPLILHVIERLKPQVDEIIINANREITQYQTLNYPVRQDETADFSGPLAGISLGFKYAKHDYLLTVPCDSPLIPLNLASRLMAALIKNDADIAVATCNGESQPVFCLCKKTVAKSLDDYLSSGERKVSTWQKRQKYIEVNFSDCSEAFVNLNTLADLAVLEAKVLP